MTVEFLFSVSCILLCLGWFFMLQKRSTVQVASWRKLLTWAGPLALTLSVVIFGLFLFWVHRAEVTNEPLSSRLDTLLPLVRMGFWTSTGATVTCCFGTGMSRIFFVLSSLLVWLLWLAQAMGV
jgi:hypothetical protein